LRQAHLLEQFLNGLAEQSRDYAAVNDWNKIVESEAVVR